MHWSFGSLESHLPHVQSPLLPNVLLTDSHSHLWQISEHLHQQQSIPSRFMIFLMCLLLSMGSGWWLLPYWSLNSVGLPYPNTGAHCGERVHEVWHPHWGMIPWRVDTFSLLFLPLLLWVEHSDIVNFCSGHWLGCWWWVAHLHMRSERCLHKTCNPAATYF